MNNEVVIRIGFFVGIFILMAAWELALPRRSLTVSRARRWFSNLTITLLNAIVVWLVFPLAPVGMALFAQQHGWGLLNNWDLPDWAAVTISVMLLDSTIYFQHILFHAVPALWRLHSMHHADLDFDVTTGLRFHPIEIILSLGIKLTAVTALGPPVAAVLIFEVLLNGISMFNHSNIRISYGLDRMLRWLVVTPDMHRVHHSVIPNETNSNFGFNLPWWDRLLGTYRAQPSEGHLDMTIGLSQFRNARSQTLLMLLALPFIDQSSDYPINRRVG